MTQRRKAAVGPLVVTAVIAVIAGVACYKKIFSNDSTRDNPTPPNKFGGSICVVVSDGTGVAAMLEKFPGLVVVGTQNAILKSGTANDFRVIETETADGWVHIVKHLRPDHLIAEPRILDILPVGIDRFVKKILTKDEAKEMGLEF